MADSDSTRPAPEAHTTLPFDVQIQRGRRAIDTRPLDSDNATSAPEPPRPLSAAAQRKARVHRWRTHLLQILAVGIVLAVGLGWWLSQPPADVLARVNGEYITTAQVNREILVNRVFAALAINGQGVAETRTATLERLISQRLQALAATRAGWTVTEADLDQAIVDLSTLQQWTPAQLDTELARQGLTRADLRASLHDIVLINRYVAAVIAKAAQGPQDAAARQNTWSAQLERTAQIDRYRNPDEDQVPHPGVPAPDFTLPDLAGQPIRLQALRGRPILLNFWATWCEPCRMEMPTLVRAYQQRHPADRSGSDLELLAVAINSAPETVVAFRKEFTLPFPVLPDTNSTVLNLYRVGPIPTSFLIDRQGVIRWVQVGIWTDSLLQEKMALIR